MCSDLVTDTPERRGPGQAGSRWARLCKRGYLLCLVGTGGSHTVPTLSIMGEAGGTLVPGPLTRATSAQDPFRMGTWLLTQRALTQRPLRRRAEGPLSLERQGGVEPPSCRVETSSLRRSATRAAGPLVTDAPGLVHPVVEQAPSQDRGAHGDVPALDDEPRHPRLRHHGV